MKLIQAYLWEQSQWRALNRQKHVVYLVLPYYQEVVILFDISEKPGMFSQQLNKLPYCLFRGMGGVCAQMHCIG